MSTSEGTSTEKDLQALMDEATEKGYIGDVFDPHPNEDYTVSKVNDVDWSDVPEHMAQVTAGTAEPTGHVGAKGDKGDKAGQPASQPESQPTDPTASQAPQSQSQSQSQSRQRK